ncbi:MAG: response regulator [Acidobacteria bacterium]|nr:response regulator [Acidobacteriota bacterium]
MKTMETVRPGAAKILVVDDDAAVREVVASMLRTAGYEVSLAANGREALSSLQREQFRVIITDLVMPEQEGIETIKLIRRDYPDVRVIAMSGAFGGDYLRIAGYLGAHGTLAKPLQLATVLKAVADALA